MALPKVIALLFCVPPAVALVGVALDMTGGGGHPPLGAVIVFFEIYPTLTGYLCRAFLETDFPPFLLILLALMEYPLVGFALAAIVTRSKGTDRRTRVGTLVLLAYIVAHLAARLLLNFQRWWSVPRSG